MKKFLLLLFFSILLQAQTITIAVAANVSYAMNDLKKEFHRLYKDIDVRVILGSSGKLTAQIKNGAPYQLFMSANMNYPQTLYKDNIAIAKPIVYAQGALAIFSTKTLDFSRGIELLKDDNIEKIAISNPKTAPYGKASVEALKNAKIYENIKEKFVYAESASQTISYSITATDVGIIAKSALFSSKMIRYKKDINFQEIDTKLYTPISQGMVILKNSKDNKDVKKFYDFILSENGKKIFKNFGYIIK